VCAGLAEYFAIDPVIVRIAAVILAFSGPGIPAYVLAWIFVPEADDDAPRQAGREGRADRGAQAFGIVLLAVAVSILLGGWWSPARRWLFPLGLIALGAWLVLRRTDQPRPSGMDSPSTSPTHPPVPTPSVSSSAGEERDETDARATGERDRPDDALAVPTSTASMAVDHGPAATGTLPADPMARPDDRAGGFPPIPPVPPSPPWSAGHGHGGPPPRRPLTDEELAARRRRKMVFPGVMGGLLVWTGFAFLTALTVQTALAVAVCIVGLGFVLGAFVGGSKALIVPAVLLTAALVLTAVLDLPMSGPVGERTWVPQTVDDLRHYEMSIGEGTLDLTELSISDGEEVEVRASLGIGHLLVIVPDDVALSVYAEASMGEVVVFGRSDSGWGPSTSRSFDRDRFDEVLGLELEVGLGQVEVISAREGDRSATLR
jgi:phage shock protein PspC (stress-responsive transcriptional regulator)